MKSIVKNILGVVLLGTMTTSCSNFLDHEPYGNKTSSGFWKTEEDAMTAANALTFWIANEGIDGRGFMWFENCSDNMITGRIIAEGDAIKNFQMTPGNSRDVRDNWKFMYQLIAKCNDIFRNIPEMTISEATKTKVLGEAHFFNGFAYMWISPYYGDNGANGGVPIVTKDIKIENMDVPRAKSVLDNYDLAIAEFEKAADMLPSFSQLPTPEWGRPHKAAAWAFAARVALYASQYDAKYFAKVIELTDKVINMGGADKRELNPNYANLYEIAENYGKEYIYSIPGTAKDGPKFAGITFQNGGWGLYNCWGYFSPTKELYDAYESGDTRRSATILAPGETIRFMSKDVVLSTQAYSCSSPSNMLFRKWMAPYREKSDAGVLFNTNTDNSSNRLSLCLIRYADVLLMKAEALIWSQGEGNAVAKDLLNQIRVRAGLKPDSQATKEQLKNERRTELAFEFQPSRHIDLVRWGDAKATYAKPLHGFAVELNNDGSIKSVSENQVWPARSFDPAINHVFPIPQREIDRGVNLIQNLGY